MQRADYRSGPHKVWDSLMKVGSSRLMQSSVYCTTLVQHAAGHGTSNGSCWVT
jgi:hypothetical protein